MKTPRHPRKLISFFLYYHTFLFLFFIRLGLETALWVTITFFVASHFFLFLLVCSYQYKTKNKVKMMYKAMDIKLLDFKRQELIILFILCNSYMRLTNLFLPILPIFRLNHSKLSNNTTLTTRLSSEGCVGYLIGVLVLQLQRSSSTSQSLRRRTCGK